MSVRVRFAPSPTGFLHVGGARTALFNYLYAKKYKGSFILRVEDTDQDRNLESALIPLLENLNWLGIQPDEGLILKDNPTPFYFIKNFFSRGSKKEPFKTKGSYGPYRQKERLAIYNKKALELIKKGKAYYCFMTPEEEAQQKEVAIKKGVSFRVSSPYRELEESKAQQKIKEGQSYCIRFKVEKTSSPYHFKDLVRGSLSFPSDSLGDFILIRTDGFPVYNFACAVDDSLMKITHVFRGEEHLSNSIKQKVIQEALGFKASQFGHLSIILDKNKKKLSKRAGSESVAFYQKEGYLPEALVNFLTLLGWNPKSEKEFFTKKELIDSFNIEGLNSSSAVFDDDKLLWLNEQHLRNKTDKQLSQDLKPFLKEELLDKASLCQKISLLKSNFKTLKQSAEILDLFLKDSIQLNKESIQFINTAENKQLLKDWIVFLEKHKQEVMTPEELKTFQKDQNHLKGPLFFKPLRCFIVGQKQGFEIKLLLHLFNTKQLLKRAQTVEKSLNKS